jgi:hypothetical protein
MFRLIVRAVVAWIFVGLGLVMPQRTRAQDLGSRPGPAWPDVFVNLGMYHVIYEKPVVGKGDKREVYRQKAIYSWTGGRYEIIHVTLARDPAFKEQFSAAALKKDKNPPTELEINKKKAWQWKMAQEPGKFDQVTGRLIVLLDSDKAILIEQIGFGASLPEMAKRFDFAKVEKALSGPPTK